MTAETLATFYCVGAGLWFAFLWLGLFAAMKIGHPAWLQIEESLDVREMMEQRPLRGELFLSLFIDTAFSALTWPVSVPRTIANTIRGHW